MMRVIGLLVILSLAVFNSADEVEVGLDTLICKALQEVTEKQEISPRAINKKVEELVENFRIKLQEGIPESGIPPLDPLLVDEANLTLNSDLIRGELNVTNLEAKGITDFILTEGSMSGLLLLTITLGLRFDTIVLTTEYAGNLALFDMINIFGKGDASITLKDMYISAEVDMRLVTQKIQRIEVEVTLPSVDAKLTGLLEDEYMSDIISRQLSDTLTSLLQEEEARINKILNAILESVVENNKKFEVSSDQSDNTAAIEDCYQLLTGITQSIKMLTEKGMLMNFLTENYFNKH